MPRHIHRYTAVVLLLALGALAVSLSAGPLQANSSSVTMSAGAEPATVAAGGVVSYRIDLTNSGGQQANDLALSAALPEGFSYVAGSASLSFNGVTSLYPNLEPAISGRTLTWDGSVTPDFVVPARRLGNYYGIHTFVQDHFYDPVMEDHLNKARAMTGEGGYVTQLLYPVTPQTQRANDNWKVFVQRACSKQLTPIVRLATRFLGSYWEKPTLDGALAQAFGRVVGDLRTVLPSNCTMYVQILNETNLTIEWSAEWPDPVAYGQFLVQASNAIRSLGDSRIKILGGALAPGGNYSNVAYTWEMLGVPGALWAWDAWASHPYPGNHPASYNIHDGTATYPELVIDSYILEMRQISKRGRHVYDVLATETGYRLTDSTYQFEGYAPVTEDMRANEMKDAFQNRWTNWPEFRAATPYELSDPSRNWWQFDWLQPQTYNPYRQYTLVRDIPYKPGFTPDGHVTLTFEARAGYNGGVQTLAASATASNAVIAPAAADVYVVGGGPSPTPSRTGTATRTRTPSPTLPPGVPTATPSVTPTYSPTPTASATPNVCLPALVTSFAVGQQPKGIAVDTADHRLHVGLFESSSLAIFDTRNYASLARIATGGVHANGVGVDADTGMVYVTNRDSNNVSAINGRTANRVAVIGVGEHPFGVAASGGRAYVANFGPDAGDREGTVTIIETQNHSVMSTVTIGPRPALAASNNGKGYVVSAGTAAGANLGFGALYALNGNSSIASAVTDFFAFGAAYLDGKVYVTHRGAKTIVVVDADDSRLLHTIAVPGPVYAAAANPTSHHVFAVDAENNVVYVVDSVSDTLIGQVAVGVQDRDHGGQGVAVDSILNKVFVANYADNSVSVIADCLTSQPATATATASATGTATRTATAQPPTPSVSPTPSQSALPTATRTATTAASATPTVSAACTPSVLRTVAVGVHPKSVAVDAAAQRVHVVLFDSSTLSIRSGDALAPLATVALAPLGSSQPNGVAVDQSTGYVYVTSRADNNLAVLDGRLGVWQTRVNVGAMPFGVAAAAGRAYVANFSANSVSVLDTTTNNVMGTVAVGSQPSLATTGDGRGYVASFGAGSVSIISGPASVQQVSAAPESLGVAYLDGRIYVGSRSGKRITVINPAGGQVVDTINAPGPVYALAANPLSGHLFAVDAANDRLYAFDAATGSLIATLAVGHQDVYDGGQGLAVDPLLGRVYVANYADGSITVVDDCRTSVPLPTPTATGPPGNYHAWLPVILHEDGATAYGAAAAAGVSAPAVARLPVTARAVAVDPATQHVYVALPGGEIAVFDEAMRRQPAPAGGMAAQTEAGALLAAGGQLYAAFPQENMVLILGTAGSLDGRATRVAGLARPFGMALSANNSLLYVAEAGASTVAVVDVQTGTLVDRLEVGRSPYLVAFAEHSNNLYVATPGDKSVWVLAPGSAAKPQRLQVPGLGLALGMTVDEKGQAYVTYALSPRLRAIARIDVTAGGAYTLQTVREGDYQLPLAESAALLARAGRLYVTDGGALWMLDAQTGAVLAGHTVNAAADSFGLAWSDSAESIVIADARGGPVLVTPIP